MFKERFTHIKPRSDDDPVNMPHDCPFLPYTQSSFKTQYFLLPLYQYSVAGCAEYFIISFRDDLHETQHSAMKDAELTWLGGWSHQGWVGVPSTAFLCLQSLQLWAQAHTHVHRCTAQTVLLGCKTHLLRSWGHPLRVWWWISPEHTGSRLALEQGAA